MRYNVEGADTVSGADRVITVEAEDERAAETLARREGLLVSAVFEAQILSPAEKLDLMVGEAIASPTSLQPTPAAPIDYRSPRVATVVPDYMGLRIASIVLAVFAGLAYLVGGLVVLFSLISMIGAIRAPSLFASGLLGLLMSCWPLFVGAVAHALSAACVALRDIARNSFR